MTDSDIYKVIKSLVGYTDNGSSSSIRAMIKTLLPIEHASGYYLSNKAEFYDPIQDEVFYRNYKYDNEKSRIDSIDYINGRIDYYNRLCDEEFSKSGAIYDYIDPIVRWGIKVKLSSPILPEHSTNDYNASKETIRTINNEYLYKCALKLDSDQFCERFNKLIYVYLNKLTGGRKLLTDNTLYNPIIEYEDWFMSSGKDSSEIKSLANGLRGMKNSDKPLAYSSDEKLKKINATYSLRANPNHKKWYSSPVESKIISLIENGMIDGFVSDCRFKNVNKINIKKLAYKLKCSDKTAKKFLIEHAPYLLD
ncbi:MAG: hypothetical protein VX731_04150 [Candidatus Neomarinimicrobiota bacterium]|nr:hypothetical protein [Candidatus Neomarinimicrobiota bacterium]